MLLVKLVIHCEICCQDGYEIFQLCVAINSV